MNWICMLKNDRCPTCFESDNDPGCHSQKVKPNPQQLKTLDDMVNHYKRNLVKLFRKNAKMYKRMETLEQAICCAANAREYTGKMSSHQWRIGHNRLHGWAKLLLEYKDEIAKVSDFSELKALIAKLSQDQHMIGTLCVYDTALRISFYLGKEPQQVHVAAGALKGALNLGLKNKSNEFSMTEFQVPLNQFSPCEIENFLCIYKDCLKNLKTQISNQMN